MSDNQIFNNSSFWNKRYTENPNLGSGIGSRGENLTFKRKLISTYLKNVKPNSILDVGCGDHEVIRDLLLPNYIGIDVSKVIISKNIIKYPNQKFICQDFLNMHISTEFKSDVILCMEVLIHQHLRADYESFIYKIVSSCHRGGLLSGYLRDPRPAIQSPIIVWHEPLADTLQRVGAKNITLEATSLETDCLGFVSFEA